METSSSIPALDVVNNESDTSTVSIRKDDVAISPRDNLCYVDDRRVLKDLKKFYAEHDTAHLLAIDMMNSIVRDKPSDVVQYVADTYFGTENLKYLKALLKY